MSNLDRIIHKRELELDHLRSIRQHGGTFSPIRSRLHVVSRVEFYPGDLPAPAVEEIGRQPRPDLCVRHTDWEENLVVDTLGTVVSALFKSQAGYGGIQYVAVGGGESAWDTTSVPRPTVGQTELVSELGRVVPTIVFLDGSNNPTLSITNRLSVSGLFGPNTANGAWREWGLFGGNATTAADSGYLMDYNTHAIDTKESGYSGVRRLRMTL